MSSIASYVGRTIDVLAWDGQESNQEVQVNPELAAPGGSGQVCTGAVKLAQRWLLEFLTVSGSMLFLPDRGCEFMALLRSGQLQTTLDVEQAFYLSAVQVKLNLTAEDTAADPPDEQLVSATLLSLAIAADTLSISVELLSQAGTTRTVILPISIAPSAGT